MKEKYTLIIDLHRGSKFTYDVNSLHEVLFLIDNKIKVWYDAGMTEMSTLVLPDGKEIETFVRIKKYCLRTIKNSPHLVMFSDLALGARFMYKGETENVWVKLSFDGMISRWEPNNATNAWIGQPICSLGEPGIHQKVQYIN